MPTVKPKKSVTFVDEPIAMSDASSSSLSSSPGGGARLSAGSPASSRHASQDGDNDKAGSSKPGNNGHSVRRAELGMAKLSVKDHASRGAASQGAEIPTTPKHGTRILSRVHSMANRKAYSSISDGRTEEGLDAQSKYPGCTLFVANLPEREEDLALKAAITMEFSQYGAVFVKMRRDRNYMPFAFVTFTNMANMEKGLASEGVLFGDRACRVEKARANRSFLVTLRSGKTTAFAARALLEEYGQVTSVDEIETGVVITFKNYDPVRDVMRALGDHPAYEVLPYDVRKKTTYTHESAEAAYLREYETNRRSIFVGGLPLNCEENELHSFFSDIGVVQDIRLHHRDESVFAFVEFASAESPQAAIDLKEPILRGYPIKVSQKKSKADHVQRSSSVQTLRPMSSRNRMRNISSRDTIRNVSSRDTIRPKPSGENVGSPARRSQPTTPRQASAVLDVVPRTPVASNRIGTQSRATPHPNNRDGVRPAPPPPFPYGPNATPQGLMPPAWAYHNHFPGAPFSPYYPQYIGPQPGYMFAMPPPSPGMLSAPPTLTTTSSAEDTVASEDHTPTRAGTKNNRRAA